MNYFLAIKQFSISFAFALIGDTYKYNEIDCKVYFTDKENDYLILKRQNYFIVFLVTLLPDSAALLLSYRSEVVTRDEYC